MQIYCFTLNAAWVSKKLWLSRMRLFSFSRVRVRPCPLASTVLKIHPRGVNFTSPLAPLARWVWPWILKEL